MSSIRRTLLWRLLGGALVLLLAGAAALYAGVSRLLTEQFDTTLRTKLSAFTSVMEQEGYDIELGFLLSMPEYLTDEDPEYLELWLPEGSVPDRYRSPALGDADLPRRFGDPDAPAIGDCALPDGRPGRTIGAEFTIGNYEAAEYLTEDGEVKVVDPGAATVTLVLARDRVALDRALATLLGGTIVGIAALLGAGILIGRGVVRRGLRPIADLARHVRAIDDPVRAERFAADAVPAELAPLAESHNQMVDRIRREFERERRTTANIAHELRTPVSELVILTEDVLRHAYDPERTARQLGELREIGTQMSTMISTLLELARMESGCVPLEIEPIDLAELARASWGPFDDASRAKGLTFRAPDGDGPLVRADRVALSILLSNLLSNAVDHAPPGDEIRCETGNGGTAGYLVLSNAANGLSAADVDKVTEPFWRASPTREDGAHAGLGLSLVARLAALLDVDLSFRVESGRFRARLGFRAPAAG